MRGDLGSEISAYLQEKAKRRVEFGEFVSHNQIAIPENVEMAKSRIILNYNRMAGNYLVVMGIIMVIYLVLHPSFIIPLSVCAVGMVLSTQNEGSYIQLLGSTFKKLHVYYAMGGVLVLFLIIKSETIVALFFTVGLGLLLCFGHMVMRKPLKDDEAGERDV